MEKHSQPKTESSKSSIIDEIEKIALECSEQNWDGYQSGPIGDEVVRHAKILVSHFPENIGEPDIVPEPDGFIGFEWDFTPNKWMIVSVDDEGNIFYAVKFDENLKSDGKIDFHDEKIRAMFNKLEIIQKSL